MRAIMKEKRGPGLALKNVDIPKINPNEVLVKVKSAAICGTDIHLYHWNQWCENVNAKNPMIMGHEYCGEVVEVGSQVQSIKIGDIVAAETHIPCGHCYQCRTGNQHVCQNMKIIGVHTDGAFAEYTVLPEVCAWKLDKNIDPAIGAVYEPFGIGVHGAMADQIGGAPAVVLGCGPIGCFAIGAAKACGATKIFAVDMKPARLEIAKKMGADVLVNPSVKSLEEVVMEETNGAGVGAVIELSASERALQSGLKVLRKGGWVALTGLFSGNVSLDLVNDVIYKQAKLYGVTGRHMYKSWYASDEFIKSGRIDVSPVITHHFPLEGVEEAIKLAESGSAGKVIIDIA